MKIIIGNISLEVKGANQTENDIVSSFFTIKKNEKNYEYYTITYLKSDSCKHGNKRTSIEYNNVQNFEFTNELDKLIVKHFGSYIREEGK